MSRATAGTPKQPRPYQFELSESAINTPISSPSVLYDNNPDQVSSALTDESKYAFANDPSILPAQRRLAEITELIHTASLLHDDVIDLSETRRGEPSANTTFGNKMAVLAGDFLLGRASVALARLRDPEVIELLATVIANLIEGEFMQLKNTATDEKNPQFSEDAISYYLQKTYLKSASLISKSCRAAAILGECAPSVVEAAYTYGRNLGLAFQLVDDMLDYTISGTELGKPAGADLELGLATAPLLFAWKSRPELGKLVGRRFAEEGDVQKVSCTIPHFHEIILIDMTGTRNRSSIRWPGADPRTGPGVLRKSHFSDSDITRWRGERWSRGYVYKSDETSKIDRAVQYCTLCTVHKYWRSKYCPIYTYTRIYSRISHHSTS